MGWERAGLHCRFEAKGRGLVAGEGIRRGVEREGILGDVGIVVAQASTSKVGG